MEIFALVLWLLLGGLGSILAPAALTNPGAGIAALPFFCAALFVTLLIALQITDPVV